LRAPLKVDGRSPAQSFSSDDIPNQSGFRVICRSTARTTRFTETLHQAAITGVCTPREYMSSHSCRLSHAANRHSSPERIGSFTPAGAFVTSSRRSDGVFIGLAGAWMGVCMGLDCPVRVVGGVCGPGQGEQLEDCPQVVLMPGRNGWPEGR
jgi:hypothetical protein